MKRSLILISCLLLLAAALVVRYGPVQAQGPKQSGYDLAWWTVDGGGSNPSGGTGYSLGSTAGQPDAGLLQGDSYRLGSGFWGGGAVVEMEYYLIYLPLVLRGF